MTRSNNCSSCGSPVIWSTTCNDKPMPLDAEPTDDGQFFLTPGYSCVHVNNKGPFAIVCRANNAPRYTSHFVTCPNAAQHRKTQ